MKLEVSQTTEMAGFWLPEKNLVHIFKVLACNTSYTKIYRAPRVSDCLNPKAKELRGDPYPSLLTARYSNRNFPHNVLLDEASRNNRAKIY